MKATVLSWTVVHRPPEGFEAPLRVVLVRTDDGRMVLAAAKNDHLLQTGARVRVSEGTAGPPTPQPDSADAG